MCQEKWVEVFPVWKIVSIHQYEHYIIKSIEILIKVTRNNSDNKNTNRTTITKKKKWKEKTNKQLYGYFKR